MSVEYVPLSKDQLINFARAVCERRATLEDNLELASADVVANFRQKDYHECQIAYREAQTSDRQRITLELTTTLEMIGRLKQFWAISGGEDRQEMARHLFEYLTYDLGKRQIVDFRLKPWADQVSDVKGGFVRGWAGER